MNTSVTIDHGRITTGAAQGAPVALGVIVALLLLRTVLLFIGDGVSYGIAAALDLEFVQVLAYSANVWIVGVDIISVLAVVWLLRRRGRTLRGLIGGFRGVDIGWGLLVFVIAGITLFVGTFIGNLIVFQGPPPMPEQGFSAPLWLGLWSLILMPVTIAVAEEVVYRGYAQEELMRRSGVAVSVLVPAVFFGLQHAAISATGLDDMLARVIGTFIAGVVFGLLRIWLKRLAPLIIGHWLLDVVGLGVPMLMLALAS